MGVADRDYMRERRGAYAPRRRSATVAQWRAKSDWKKFFIMAAVLGLLFLLSKYALEGRSAQPFPPTGEVRWYTAIGNTPSAPLTIMAPIGKRDWIVLLDDWHSRKPVAMIPIRAGETASLKVPLGRYRITMANGTRWLGGEKLFGWQGEVREAVDPLAFYATDRQHMGHRIELASRMHGNMPTRPANPF